jgi:hypothetical protein
VIPGKLLRALLASAISDLELDVDEYLAGNPDIAASLPGKDADQIERHFKTVGYFEDRLMPLRFDPSFYLREYPDVACELDEGKLSHPKEHFVHCGTHEWRAPNPMARHEVTFWRGLLESGAGEQAQVAVAESHELAGELSADTASRSGSHRAF